MHGRGPSNLKIAALMFAGIHNQSPLLYMIEVREDIISWIEVISKLLLLSLFNRRVNMKLSLI